MARHPGLIWVGSEQQQRLPMRRLRRGAGKALGGARACLADVHCTQGGEASVHAGLFAGQVRMP